MLVSLMISTYNWKEALSLCLYSAFAQTVKPCEILIADDGSRDDTKQLIEKMRTKTDIPIVHVWHEDKGFRLSAIRNRSIERAKGDYIIQIDGDILWIGTSSPTIWNWRKRVTLCVGAVYF